LRRRHYTFPHKDKNRAGGAPASEIESTMNVLKFGYEAAPGQGGREIGRAEATFRAWALGALAVSLLLRLVFGARVELMPEEAYYWNYARHLDFGYLDHPPMVAWLIWAGTAVFGNVEFGVRLGAVLCGLIATFFTYRLTRDLFGTSSALVSVALMQTLPFFFLSGMMMTPDAPLAAAWAASLYFIERALLAGRAGSWWLAGVAIGLGLLSKYTISLVVLSTIIFVLLESRAWLRRVEPYAAILIACAIFAPVIVWNAEHEWASFLFQTSRRLAEKPQFALHKLLGSMLVLLTPPGFAGVAWVLTRGRPGTEDGAERRRAWRFVQVSTLVPLGVFLLFSLRHEVKLDWTGAPWIAVVPGLGRLVARAWETADPRPGWRWVRGLWAPTVIGLLLLYGVAFFELAVGIPNVGYARHAELEPVGWRQLGREVSEKADEIARQEGRDPIVVGMDRYAIASELAFYGSDQTKSVSRASSGHLFGQIGLMYERWLEPKDAQGRTLLLVAWSRGELSGSEIERRVEKIDPIEEGRLSRDGALIRPYYYRVAHGYLGLEAR
jgi:dolichol-phosphate mannosyltransferase